MRFASLLCFASSLALAQVNECAEAFSECKEDCALEFSSIRPEVQKKLGKCLKKCAKKRSTCEERELETRSNDLEPGSLDRAPASSDVDENGMPNRVSGAAKEREPARRLSSDEDLRDDRPPPTASAPAKKGRSDADERRPPRDEVQASELPKSSRTQLKTDEREARAEPKPTPEPVRSEPPKQRPADDLRDEGLRRDDPVARREEPPARKPEKKKDDLPPAPPRPKEEDHDDLRNY